MRTKLNVATALAGTLLATCLVSGSVQATSLPVLKGDATPGVVTLVGGHGGGGGHGHGGHGHGGHGHGGHGHGGHGHGGHGHGGHGHGHGHGHAHWNNNNWNHGHRHGHGRYWGGRWYGYGVGACWRWTPGGYVWICY